MAQNRIYGIAKAGLESVRELPNKSRSALFQGGAMPEGVFTR
jgi:hypothetical protein